MVDVEPRWKAGARRSRAKRSAFAAAVRARAGGRCEVCPFLARRGIDQHPRAGDHVVHDGHHPHHVKLASRGGLDHPDNGVWTCWAAHRWIHADIPRASRLGLMASATAPDPTVAWPARRSGSPPSLPPSRSPSSPSDPF